MPRRRVYLAATVVLAALVAALYTGSTSSVASASPNKAGCATIQSGTITDSAGNPITVGFDKYGYNYQAHEYNGTYDGLDRVLDGKYYGQTGPWVEDSISMKWSNAWLANVDCNGDHKLDRGLGTDGYATDTSEGWLTNHVHGKYVDSSGAVQSYEDFVKIGYTGPGSPLWGSYTVLQEVYNDTGGGSYRIKLGVPGLGLDDGWTTVG